MRELGRGGMGVVLEARHLPTGARRALKVLEGVPDLETLERFRREAEALARLGGSGVIAVHEVGTDERRCWFAMDLAPGGSLKARLDAGPLAPGEACALVAKLARTLERAHARGLVHRDVKAENVLLGDDGEPRLADWGCVRDLGRSTLTATGQWLGTTDAMAPEQLRGERAGAPADVWALGVLLHRCVAGAPPFAGPPHRILEAALAGRRDPVPGPPALEALVRRALEPRPEARPPAGELAAALEALASGEPGGETVPLAKRASSRGVGLLVAALALAATALLGLGGARLLGVRPSPSPAASAPPPRPLGSPSPSPTPVVSSPSSRPVRPLSKEDLDHVRDGARVAAEALARALAPTATESERRVDAKALFHALAALAPYEPDVVSRHMDLLGRATWDSIVEQWRSAEGLDAWVRESVVKRCDPDLAARSLAFRSARDTIAWVPEEPPAATAFTRDLLADADALGALPSVSPWQVAACVGAALLTRPPDLDPDLQERATERGLAAAGAVRELARAADEATTPFQKRVEYLLCWRTEVQLMHLGTRKAYEARHPEGVLVPATALRERALEIARVCHPDRVWEDVDELTILRLYRANAFQLEPEPPARREQVEALRGYLTRLSPDDLKEREVALLIEAHLARLEQRHADAVRILEEAARTPASTPRQSARVKAFLAFVLSEGDAGERARADRVMTEVEAEIHAQKLPPDWDYVAGLNLPILSERVHRVAREKR